MLALLVAVALSQCTKDTDCKGERICAAGACVDGAPTPPPAPQLTPSPLVPRAPAQPARDVVADERVRVMHMGRLEHELRQLREELDDATLAGPIVKMVFAGLLTVATGALVGTAIYIASPPPGDARPTIGLAGTSAVVSGLLWLWGGLQLRLRLTDRDELPKRIAAKEEEYARVRAGRDW